MLYEQHGESAAAASIGSLDDLEQFVQTTCELPLPDTKGLPMESEGLRAANRSTKDGTDVRGIANSPKAPDRKGNSRVAAPLRSDPIALGDLSTNLGYRIRRAQLWVFKDISRRLASLEVSPAQFSVLSIVGANPGINQLAVASVLSIERAGLGRLIDRLERQGLVARNPSPTNRRYYVLSLTPAGKTLLKRLRPIVAQREKVLAEKLGQRTYKELVRALSIFLRE